MIRTKINNGTLTLTMEGLDRLWSLRHQLDVPIEHVRSVRTAPGEDITRGPWAWRLGGTFIPGVVTAGSYLRQGKWLFWCVHNPSNAVKIELNDEHYSEVVVEVPNPGALVNQIESEIAERKVAA